MTLRIRPPHRTAAFVAAAIALAAPAIATPPDYATYGRPQRIDHTPDASRLLRIWMVYVDQGDGLLIQLPTALTGGDTDRTDILIDGGAAPTSNSHLIRDFLEALYGADGTLIEHAVITHHDQDHVAGLTELLDSSPFTFGRIVHNGLASYRGGVRNIPVSGTFRGVSEKKSGKISRSLGAVIDTPDGPAIDDSYAINSLAALRIAFQADQLHGVYEDLARPLIARADNSEVAAFDRVKAPADFLTINSTTAPSLGIRVIWPGARLRPYDSSGWGETINGNSVTLRLQYGDFSMLLTGDHNEHSEDALLDSLGGDATSLRCDVLKVPHHGSNHALEEFFRPGGKPLAVLSVASMGAKGFGDAWKHPSDKVIGWLGGSHRFYSTFIHERAFKWATISVQDQARMVERTHILIETDGTWFRIVEVPAESFDPDNVPAVSSVSRGDGTRWIEAKDPAN